MAQVRSAGAGLALALIFGSYAAPVSAADAPGSGSFTVGPDYPLDPALTDLGAAKGRRFQFIMAFADSRVFRGDDRTLDLAQFPVRKERVITVYVPAGYRNGDRAPVLVFFDGPGKERGTSFTFSNATLFDELLDKTANAVDNLSASKDPARRLPPFVIVAIQNGGSDRKGSERNLEYDTMSDRNARFIHDEVLPAVEANREIRTAYPGFALTRSPDGRAVMGCSSGGAAALTAGWFRPDWFRRVIAYSATLIDNQPETAPEEARYPLAAWEYHSGMQLIRNSPKKPLRIFNHVSEQDAGADTPEERHFNWVIAGKRTSEALDAKGYDHRFVFSLATRHCDAKVFDRTLADTLVWSWKGYAR